MRNIIAVFVLALGYLTSGAVLGQEKLLWAAGDAKGGSTYYTMATEFVKSCGKGYVDVLSTDGGTSNRELLIGNKVNIAMMQSDMLEFTRRNDPDKVSAIKTLFALHPEEVHIIARADTRKEGKILGFGGTDVTFNSLNDLAGRKIGAVGGSFDTASVISGTAGLKLQITRVANNTALQEGLLNGTFDAIVVVGGAQHPMVSKLTKAFRLIPIPKEVADRLVASKLYSPAKLSYDNLGAVGIPTVSTRSLVVTRTYRSKAMINQLKELRACFEDKLGDIQDARGTHAKWQAVDSSVKGGWAWYEFN